MYLFNVYIQCKSLMYLLNVSIQCLYSMYLFNVSIQCLYIQSLIHHLISMKIKSLLVLKLRRDKSK